MRPLRHYDGDEARRLGAHWALERGLTAPKELEALACDVETFAAVVAHKRPALHLEDVSAIPFVNVIAGVERYQHRARVRSFTGDVFAAVTPISEGYEEYCGEFLKLGAPHLVMAEPVDEPTAVARACAHGSAFGELVRWGRDAGSVAIHPYMSHEDVWELGGRLRAEGIDIRVLGPVPHALWVANDKSKFDEVVRLVAGDDWVVRTIRRDVIEQLAVAVSDIARDSQHVALKRTRCASAMGNIVWPSDQIRQLSTPEIEGRIRHFLERTEWDGREEVLAVEWLETDLSPSTQVWIPPVGGGEPVVEGIYEQLLEGTEKVFLGSRPSTLPQAVHDALTWSSMRVSAAFQAMGYVGRCSFDFVVVGDVHAEFDARFTECNGRWGGTSTPMFLVDRVTQGPRPAYHAQDWVHPDLVGATFHDLKGALGEHLWNPDTQSGRFVLYNVGPLHEDGKFDVISIGQNPEDAVFGARELIPRLLGVD